MLAVLSPLGNLNGPSGSTRQQQSAEIMDAFSIIGDDEFPVFSSGNLLESIDFDDLFSDSDVLPDLEMDNNNLLAEFSLSSGDDYCYSDIHTATSVEKTAEDSSGTGQSSSFGMDNSIGGLMSVSNDTAAGQQGDEEMVSKRDPDPAEATKEQAGLSKKHSKAHKSNSKSSSKGSASNKEGLPGKRKVKVDWTPELHRRFVQAVEQLGVDKAVPSRILEIMRIDCLTRHNIASHLQKYRSHRKHLLAREAEAANWTQRRHAYAGVTAGAVVGNRECASPWLVPTIGFPPAMTSPPQPLHGHRSRPLHVWGHPSVDQSLRPVWPKLSPSHPPLQPHPIWPSPSHPLLPQNSSSYWQNPLTSPQQRIRNGLCQGAAPGFSPTLGTITRFPVQPIQGFPTHAMYNKVVSGGVGVVSAGQLTPHSLPDFHPSKESLDAAIGDVLSKPWLPLPIGLKPPELDSVMGELQRNGVSNIPPAGA